MRRIVFALACIVSLTFSLVGCNATPGTETTDDSPDTTTTDNLPDTTDEMWSESRSDVEIEVYVQDGHVYTVDYGYEIPELADYDELVDGAHYILTADVTFINGGIAGYVDYPEIDRIISIEEIPSAPDKTARRG